MKYKDYGDFLNLLLFLHPRVQKPISAHRAINIYMLAHEYHIPTVLERTETLIVEKVQSLCISRCPKSGNRFLVKPEQHYNDTILNKAFTVLVFAKTYGNSKICSSAVERISKVPAEYFIAHPCYKQLSESGKNDLLLRRLKLVDGTEKGFS